jgi:hypothetical protein
MLRRLVSPSGCASTGLIRQERRPTGCKIDHAQTRPPQVSSNPAMREECLRGARFVSHLLEGLGAEVKVTLVPLRHPVHRTSTRPRLPGDMEPLLKDLRRVVVTLLHSQRHGLKSVCATCGARVTAGRAPPRGQEPRGARAAGPRRGQADNHVLRALRRAGASQHPAAATPSNT